MVHTNRDESPPDVLLKTTWRSRFIMSPFKYIFGFLSEPNIGAAIIAASVPFAIWYMNNISHQKGLVTSYIESVQVLLLDQYHESGNKNPEITLKHIELFVKSKAGTTIKNLDDKEAKARLISFLRQAKIGFQPRSSSQLTKYEENLLHLLKGIDLSQANLDGSDFSYALLRGADLTGASLREASLSEADLRKSRLGKAKLRGGILGRADLREAQLVEADLSNNCKIFKLFVIAQVWKKKEKTRQEKLFCKQTDLLAANLRGANLQKADLRGARLIGANLVYTQFIDKDSNEENKASINNETSLTYALYAPNNETKFPEEIKTKLESNHLCMIAIKPQLNLSELLKQEDCKKQEEVLRKTIFAEQNFSEGETSFDKLAPFQKTDLSRTNLQGADLTSNVNFFQTNLAEANLTEANLTEANLAEADLAEAILAEANLTEANLTEANLAEANLAQANFTRSQIKSACNWRQAFYKAEYNEQEKRWVTLEAENKKYIEDLKNDKSSDPEQPVDCSKWN